MKKKIKKEIVYAFIDSQNLNLGVRSQGWELDFARFRTYLKEKYKVQKSYLFIGMVPSNEGLYKYLQESGYILIFKPTLELHSKNRLIKGNVDAELVLHTMIEYPNYDKAIIVSGDGDFHCLINYLDSKGKMLKLIVPNKKGFSYLLRKFRKYIIYVNSFRRKVESSGDKKRGNNLRTKP